MIISEIISELNKNSLMYQSYLGASRGAIDLALD